MADYASHCPKLPWMVDFHSAADGTIPNTQLRAAFADNQIDYMERLNIDSPPAKRLLTSIICTIGPASNNAETIEKMMKAGMRAARINMSFYNVEECAAIIKTLKKTALTFSKRIGRIYPLAIVVDIKGPEIRTGNLKNVVAKTIKLEEGDTVKLITDPAYEEHVTSDTVYIDYPQLTQVVSPGDVVYIDNVRLSALEIVGSIIRCLIETAGNIASKSKVSIPEVPIDLPFLDDKDMEDLSFCANGGVDAVMCPVSSVANARRCREILGDGGKSVMVLAKIYSVEGIHNIDEILKEVDGVVLTRFKVSLDMPQEKAFIAQKSIIAKCNKIGKPIICAPEMLESMAHHLRPTNAELYDVANTILDGADGIILSKETSVGKYPVETVETLHTLCREAESGVFQKQICQNLMNNFESPMEIIHGLALNSVEIALKTNAAVIVVTTTTGRTAKLISRYRPRCPIVAITRLSDVARKLHLYRGVDPLLYIKPIKQDWNKELMRRVQLGITYSKMSGFVRAGDAIVIVMSPKPGAGFTNTIKVVYASEFDALPGRCRD